MKNCNIVWHLIQGFKFLLRGFKNKKQRKNLPLLYILLTLISSSVYIPSWGISHWALLPWKPLKLMWAASSWTTFFLHSQCKDKFWYCNCNGSIGAHYYKPSRIYHTTAGHFSLRKKISLQRDPLVITKANPKAILKSRVGVGSVTYFILSSFNPDASGHKLIASWGSEKNFPIV